MSLGKVGSRAAVALGSVVVTLILAELGLRLFSPIPPTSLLPFPFPHDRLERIVTHDTYTEFDQDLGWTLATSRVRREGSLLFRTNSIGMRADREYPPHPPSGVRRISAYGDSFTYCSEVTQAECWVPLLERYWPGTEVLNFGVRGYGPDQVWLHYGRNGPDFHPCAVLIGYFVEGIDRVINRFRPFLAHGDGLVLGKPRFVLDGDDIVLLENPVTRPSRMRDPHWVEETLGPHDAWYFPGTFVAHPLDVFQVVRLARTAAYRQQRAALLRDERNYPLYNTEHEAFQITGQILIRFAEQVRQDGATPVVIIHPGKADVAAPRAGAWPHAPLVDWLTREGIATLDLTDHLAAEADRVGIARLFGQGHYATAGNDFVAATLAEQLPSLIGPACGT